MSAHVRTRAVHAGREDFAELGVHAPPIDLSSTYPLRDLDRATDSLDAMAHGKRPRFEEPVYARLHNPTVARFEDAFAVLEECDASVAFASGMAALTAVLMAVRERGSEVVAVRPLYGGSDHLLASEMLGSKVKWATADTVDEVVGPDTALVVVETPANPTNDLVDIEAIAALIGDVPLLVDNTFATPVLQNPARHGATFVLHSATKFLGGHGDVVAGVVACPEAWAEKLRSVRVATGAILHPLGAYLLHRGLATLPLRVEAQQLTATTLATRLLEHPVVETVRHPSVPGQDPRRLLGRQMRGPGSLIAFDVAGGHDVAAQVMKSTQWFTPAVSLGSVDSLIQHPAGLTHHVVDRRAREKSGIRAGTLRLSVGLEHVDDLWEDLDQALRAAAAHVLTASF